MKKDILKINMSINEFVDVYKGSVGCVYPYNADSYCIGTNLRPNLACVELNDGYLFAEDSMRNLAQSGFPATYFEYDEIAYQKAYEERCKIIGSDAAFSTAWPLKKSFRTDLPKDAEAEELLANI